MAETGNIPIYKCPKCGSTQVSIPKNATGDSQATCGDCGAELGTWGDVKKSAAADAKKMAVRMAKAAFKGIGRR